MLIFQIVWLKIIITLIYYTPFRVLSYKFYSPHHSDNVANYLQSYHIKLTHKWPVSLNTHFHRAAHFYDLMFNTQI